MSKLSELDPKWVAIISTEAEELWQEKYPDALALCDTSGVVKAVETDLRINGFPPYVLDDFNPATLVRALSETFTALLRRGALDPYIKMPATPEAQAQLDEMAGITTVVDPVTEVRNARAAALDEVTADFRGRLDSRSFKSKWLSGDPAKRAVYEQAIALGRV